jgi:hypothetical protein
MFRKELLVGFEAEVFVKNSDGIIVPVPMYLPHDDYPVLAEIRSDPKGNTAALIGDFITHSIMLDKSLKENINMETRKVDPLQAVCSGFETIDLSLHRKVLPQTHKGAYAERNVYNIHTDEFPDDVLNDQGKVVGKIVSCGLHIHLSALMRSMCAEYKSASRKGTYEQTGKIVDTGDVVNLLAPRAVQEALVIRLDTALFHNYTDRETHKKCKYRHPGFYETKPYGFEYRSLPYNEHVQNHLVDIADEVFQIFRNFMAE